MPDTRVKVFKGEYPDQDVIGKMKLGDKFLWIPDKETRKMGVCPVLCIIESYAFNGRQKVSFCMPYHGVGLAMLSRG